MKSFILLFTLTAALAPQFSQAEEQDACAPVFKACEAQGFTKDEAAAAGKKIWADCANPIIFQGKMVPTVEVTAKVAKKCKMYKVAKDEFTKNWNEKHKND
jgi:hypothetical protein